MAAEIKTTVLPTPGSERLVFWFSICFGATLGLSLLKFGNPPIMEKWVTVPANSAEVIFGYPWPMAWGYTLLTAVTLLGLAGARWRNSAPWWVLASLGAWWVWQVISTALAVEDQLSTATLKHLTACVVCFCLGYFTLSRTERLWPFWMGIFIGLLIVLLAGWEQHFGGLKASREYFLLYVYPQAKDLPPGYLKKLSSDRIFATLFYPNALAGAIILILPPTVALLWRTERFTRAARQFLIAVVSAAALACLYWSGSKGGWLLMLGLCGLALMRLPVPVRHKVAIICGVVVVGVGLFFARHLGFFQKGATSVSARFDYWEAAIKTARSNPWFGTGPGTFFIAYQKIKRPESEPSRLVHNDYLEQASDSGIPGMVFYTVFIGGSLAISIRRKDFRTDYVVFALWLGVFGWSLHSLFEFSLYIPALAWLALALLGWLAAGAQRPLALAAPSGKLIEKPKARP